MLEGWIELGIRRSLGSLRRGLARTLSDAVLQLDAERRESSTITLLKGELPKLAAIAHLDFNGLKQGHVEVQYRALDSKWRTQPEQANGMIPLHTTGGLVLRREMHLPDFTPQLGRSAHRPPIRQDR
jgi:hypothetical protein